mgnify:CR=1 FL=1
MIRSWKLAVAGIAVVGFVCVWGTNLSAAEESPAVQGDKKEGDAHKAAPGGKGQARGKREGKGGAPADPKKAAEMRKAAFLRQNPEADLDKDGKWQLVGQARAPFSQFDNLENNYQFWAGLRWVLR